MDKKEINNMLKIDKKVVDSFDEIGADDQTIIDELEEKIDKMIDDREAKCASAKEHLVESLKVTADKYRTATGVMEALRVIRMVNDGNPGIQYVKEEIEQARSLAIDMAKTTEDMAKRAKHLIYEEMDQLCNGFYKPYFAGHDVTSRELMQELMCLDLCRNVGPAVEDIVEFYKSTSAEIDDTMAKLNEMRKKEN